MKTKSFITEYLRACGRTEVPQPFHLWSCISLIAALLGDRVWFVKHAGDKLYPNLYTILIGKSASGKGSAIKRCTKIVKEVPQVYRYRGKATGAHLSDVFARVQMEKEEKGLDEPPSIYLVFPELSDSVGEGPQANDFIKRFTNIFEAEDDLHQEGTRTHGALSYRIPIANCLFGTTEDWLYESVSKAALRSGFIARCCTVKADYDPKLRIPTPEYPKDYGDIMGWLIGRAKEIAKTKGQFRLTHEAVEAHETWYKQRPFPEDEALQPSWKRADDLLYKFGIIVSVAKGREKRVITSHDIMDAIQLIDTCHRDLGDIIHGAHRGLEIENLETIALYIRQASRGDVGFITHTDLLKKASHRNITAGSFNGVKAQVRDLIDRGEIRVVRIKDRPKAIGYRWVDDRITLGGKGDGSKPEDLPDTIEYVDATDGRGSEKEIL